MAIESFNREVVEAEYQRLGYSYGWTFMMTPEARMRDARIAIVGPNPGGGQPGEEGSYGGQWDCPDRNAYFEEWGAGEPPTQIQAQFQAWHRVLKSAQTDTLCAQFVPFRSPNWQELRHKEQALSFSSKLWQCTLAESSASLFIKMGRIAAEGISTLLEGRHVAQFPTGWGKMTIDVWDCPSGRRIVNRPHPRQYLLFGGANGGSDIAEANLRIASGLTA